MGGASDGWSPAAPLIAGQLQTPDGRAWLEPLPEEPGAWLELSDVDAIRAPALAPALASIVGPLLANTREEVELLYGISEILGRTVSLTEAAQTIIREAAAVVGAERASIMVYDERQHALLTAAAIGFDAAEVTPVPVDDPSSIAARVFRTQAAEARAAREPRAARQYSGASYLSVPIRYAAPGVPLRCVGVLNFTERTGGDRFTAAERQLVTTVANFVAVAVENARLVARERTQQRLRRELELAADLQRRILPSPTALHGDATVAARCVPAEWVGGDFYTFSRLGNGRVGVMLGDVSSHGFSAALVMALVLSAAGVHAAAPITPDETLTALVEGLSGELARTEMYLTVFYGVLDRARSQLVYANAGHPYAFRVGAAGIERLGATGAPLGLADGSAVERCTVAWQPDDLLCLWTDGLEDARNGAGEKFGERRILDVVTRLRDRTPDEIVETVLGDAEAFASGPGDDRTMLVLRL
jgi:sigma-B regulation protein RsbU (phosphoserine phosphatase)